MIALTAPLGGFVLLHDILDVVLAPDDPPTATDRLPQSGIVRMLLRQKYLLMEHYAAPLNLS